MFRPQFLVSETGFRDYIILRKVKRGCLDTTYYFVIYLILFYIVQTNYILTTTDFEGFNVLILILILSVYVKVTK